MEDIPALVLQHILSLVPLEDRPACREVCRRWFLEIETSPFVGLSAKVDNRIRQPNFLQFLRKVIVKEVNFAALILEDGQDQDFDFWMNLNLEFCKTVIISGYTSPLFINGNLLQPKKWSHLSKLYFCGTFLCQELWKSGKDQPVPICFLPNLKELQLMLPKRSLNVPRRSGHFRKRLCDRTHMNCSYLLSVVQSPNLKSFHLVLYTTYFWDLEPLYKFIEEYGFNLVELIISPFDKIFPRYPPNPYPDANRRLCPTKGPINLRSLFLKNIHSTQRFWMGLVKAQEHLEELFVNSVPFHSLSFQNFLSDLVIQNYEALKYLYIIGDNRRGGIDVRAIVNVDLKPLNLLNQLEVLVISFRARFFHGGFQHGGDNRGTFSIKNIHELPQSLKVFRSSFVTPYDFNGIRFMNENPNLEELELSSLSRTGFLKERLQLSDFVRATLRHRRLKIFRIKFNREEHNHYEKGHGIPLVSDRILEILKGEKLIVGIWLGGAYSSQGYRNLFDALDGNASTFNNSYYKEVNNMKQRGRSFAEAYHPLGSDTASIFDPDWRYMANVEFSYSTDVNPRRPPSPPTNYTTTQHIELYTDETGTTAECQGEPDVYEGPDPGIVWL